MRPHSTSPFAVLRRGALLAAGLAALVTASAVPAAAHASGRPSVTLPDTAFLELGSPAPASTEEWLELLDPTIEAAPDAPIASVRIDSSFVDFARPGTYSVRVIATDVDGKEETGFTYLNIEDTTPPEITAATTFVKLPENSQIPMTLRQDIARIFGVVTTDISAHDISTGDLFVNGTLVDNPEPFAPRERAGVYTYELYGIDMHYNRTTEPVVLTLVVQAPPVGTDASATVAPGSSVSFDTASNVSTTGTLNPLSAADLGSASKGSVTLDGDRITYTANPDATGEDAFTVTFTDDVGQTVTVTYTITITPGAGATIAKAAPAEPAAKAPVAAQAASTQALASTGSDVLPLAWAGAAAFLLGLPLLLWVRRRRNEDSST